jgi:hypothetical protein
VLVGPAAQAKEVARTENKMAKMAGFTRYSLKSAECNYSVIK